MAFNLGELGRAVCGIHLSCPVRPAAAPWAGGTAAASVLLNRERPGVSVEELLHRTLMVWPTGEVTAFHVITVLLLLETRH